MIPYYSPRHLTEFQVDEALDRRPDLRSKEAFGKWIQLCDCKAVLRLILNLGLPYNLAMQLFCIGMQTGFDLHAQFGDADVSPIGEGQS